MKSSALAAVLMISAGSASGAVIFADDFNRPNGALGSTSVGNHSWQNVGGSGTTFTVEGERMRLHSLSPHESRRAFVDYDLDAVPTYTASFTLTATNLGGEAAMLFLPRAEGTDIVGNSGWLIRSSGIFVYGGGARTSGSIAQTGTAITSFTLNTLYTFRVEVNENTANLFINNAPTANSTIDLGDVADNGTADRFMFGYNQTSTSGRNLTMFIDDFQVIPEPGSVALVMLSLCGFAFSRRR